MMNELWLSYTPSPNKHCLVCSQSKLRVQNLFILVFGFYKIWRPEPESYIIELIFSKTYGQLRLEFCSCFTALLWYIIWLSVPLSFLQKVEDAEDSRTRKVSLFLIYPMWQCGCILQLLNHVCTSHHITIGCTQEKILKKDIRLGDLIPL